MKKRDEASWPRLLRNSLRYRIFSRSFGVVLFIIVLPGVGGVSLLLLRDYDPTYPVVAIHSNKVTAPTSGNKFSATMEFKITAKPGTEYVVFNVLLPRSISGRQRILDVDCKPKPTIVYEQDGQTYAQFHIDQFPEGSTVVIDIIAEIYRSDYATAARDGSDRLLEDKNALGRWLVDEQFLETYSPIVKQAADGLSGKDEETTLRNCFDYVANTLATRPYDDKDYGAVWALNRRMGDCTECADLFIALCRSKGIPARFCQGYSLEHGPDTSKHDWAEAYTEKYGWVPFDPSSATFSVRHPIYLIIYMHRKNGALRDGHYWFCGYWGARVQIQENFRVNKVKEFGHVDGPGYPLNKG